MSLWEGGTAGGDIWDCAEGQAEQGGLQLLRLLDRGAAAGLAFADSLCYSGGSRPRFGGEATSPFPEEQTCSSSGPCPSPEAALPVGG